VHYLTISGPDHVDRRFALCFRRFRATQLGLRVGRAPRVSWPRNHKLTDSRNSRGAAGLVAAVWLAAAEIVITHVNRTVGTSYWPCKKQFR
jgi:hypothetical protein